MSRSRTRVKLALFVLATTAIGPARAAQEDDFDPASISEVDAIHCRLDAPEYNGFVLSLGGTDGIAAARHWRKVKQGNSFLEEYELPAPITVAGSYATRQIAFSASAIVAILDVPDPAVVGRNEQIENEVDAAMAELIAAAEKAGQKQVAPTPSFRKFLGERVLVDVVDPAKGEQMYGTHTVIARTLSNASTHPDKTLYGCSYRIEMLDANGQPL